ncbi:MAG: hypothetical protein LEGION0398_MBIBDBAK_00209 [Legionellaceae bacterium]
MDAINEEREFLPDLPITRVDTFMLSIKTINDTVLYGNKCGHKKDVFRSPVLPLHHKERPSVLEKAKERLANAFLSPKKYLASLSFLNPSHKQKKSERREAICAVLCVLLHHTELDTLEVRKVFTFEYSRPLSLKEIAQMANIPLWRATRALRDVVKAGYLTCQKRFKKTSAMNYYGEYSLRKLTHKFFKEVGINLASLEKARHWKRKKAALAYAKAKNLFQELLKNKSFTPTERTPKVHSSIYDEVLKKSDEIAQKLKNGQSLKSLLKNALSRPSLL